MLHQARIGKVQAAILLVFGTLLGANLIAPAMAHLTTYEHAVKHFGTKAVGAISVVDINGFRERNFTTILTKNISVPSKGVLMVVGSVGTEGDCSLDGISQLLLRLRIDGKKLTEDPFGWEASSSCQPGSLTVADSTTLTAVVGANAGTHTVQIQAREKGNGTFIHGRALSIAFFPKGAGVNIPVPDPDGPGLLNA
jgi:hypothetical protein